MGYTLIGEPHSETVCNGRRLRQKSGDADSSFVESADDIQCVIKKKDFSATILCYKKTKKGKESDATIQYRPK